MDEKLLASPKAVRDFLVYMETIKGKSPGTVREYENDLRTFFRFIKQMRGSVPRDTPFDEIAIDDVDIPFLASITLADIYEYLNYITNERKNRAASRARKVSSLRSFYKYLCERAGILQENPTRDLEAPKQKKSLPKYLTLEESMEVLRDIDGKFAARDYCIMTLFLNCGMRLSELVGLNLSDIRNSTMTVTGKGNKQRTIYLNEACLQALERYLAVRAKDSVKDRDALFLSNRLQRISPKTVQAIVYKYLERAGLSGRGLSVHKLRHTAATLLYQHGHVDVRVLQEILGHENLSTTEIYTHLSDRQLQDAVNRSPLAHFSGQKAPRDKEKPEDK
ncbi:tyrosine recombinase XerC [Ethanoligenens harbinense]|uniref:Integrase family protein n=1 Tax=Ethanoligenens harbinense (strain DSM 18485 / JCM 12961 / CGMCC 1.5033 / YUAN-3) TaxID=663278 RepID=E6U6Y3_ETHHY|nr:tyrosine recombinase XerC [Ethanoligenens harbinense]ADU26950.1 integrase family protein [Ethanoligenens harbinense YUAN-3]AVQ96042.1 tyrosine recombinase XerC [Ethanoligenens harbinense YUAN-3]AYF38703.1 tyrosine recombinase XerC [Ethanoligenens harbinense]QCN92284.1 tyrosine recombinase XerC [Ethanoligenens harbinense]